MKIPLVFCSCTHSLTCTITQYRVSRVVELRVEYIHPSALGHPGF